MSAAKEAYSTPAFDYEIDLKLNANESLAAIPALNDWMGSLDERFISHYPDHQPLQDLIGSWIGVDADRIVVTAGGDESIDRMMRVLVSSDRPQVVTHAPSFEMVRIYAHNYGGQVVNVPWLKGDFPTQDLIQAIDSTTAVAVITTPNNPSGREVGLDDILQVNQHARQQGAMLLVDHAYVEFAKEDCTKQLIDDDNIMLVRTFSKAWGLAGLRVGFMVAPNAEFAATIRNAAGPFPVSAVSLETARYGLENCLDQMQANVQRIVKIRDLMVDLMQRSGGRPLESGGNYLLVEFDDAEQIWEGLAKSGIGVRKFVGNPVLTDYLRITSPASVGDYLRLARAMTQITSADFEVEQAAAALVFDEPHVCRQSTPEAGLEGQEISTEGRAATLVRETKETKISLSLNLDGVGNVHVETGIGFLDHMLTALAFHSGLDLDLRCNGDLYVDDHHTAEDCALALGTAIDQALGPRKGIKRFGYAYAPLDEALARSVVDLSGRPWPEIHLQLERPMIGQWACENITHFFQSLAMTLKCSLHVDVLRGTNDHHRAEAAFKSLAKALKEALTPTSGDVPSTKGVL